VLFFVLLGISVCTMKNFPRLTDVGSCQYRIRSVIIKIIPVREGAGEERAHHPSVGIVCPAYLVPLNERSAGKCECSALKTLFCLLLTVVPTIVNLGMLTGFDGSEPSWLSYLLCEIDGKF
jgi:hypothetical protein